MSLRLGHCHTCNRDVNLSQRPIRGSTTNIQFEYICSICREPFVELRDTPPPVATPPQHASQSHLAINIMNPFMNMINPFQMLQGAGPLAGIFGGLMGLPGSPGFSDLISTLDGNNEEDFQRILRIIEQHESMGQSPADPTVVESLPRYVIDEEFRKKWRETRCDINLKITEKMGDGEEISPKEDKSDQKDEKMGEYEKNSTDYEESDGPECKVCLSTGEDGDEMIELPCAHVFHTGCFTEWAKGHNSCPLCRHKLPSKPINHDNLSATAQMGNFQVRVSTHTFAESDPQDHWPRPPTAQNEDGSITVREVRSNPNSAVARARTAAATAVQPNSTTYGSRVVYNPTTRVREVARPDGTTVIIDDTGVRIREVDGTVRLIGTSHSLRHLNHSPTPTISSNGEGVGSLSQLMLDAQVPPIMGNIDGGVIPRERQNTPIPGILMDETQPLTSNNIATITTPPTNTPQPINLTKTANTVYGRRFRTPGTTPKPTPTPASSNLPTSAEITSPPQKNENTPLNEQPAGFPVIPAQPTPIPKANPFKRNFRG